MIFADKMDSQKDLLGRIRRHSTHSRESNKGPLKATDAAIGNQRRFSEASRNVPDYPQGRRASSGCIPQANSSPDTETMATRSLSIQSMDNAGLAMRRAVMMQRQNATIEDPSDYEQYSCNTPRPPTQPRPKSAKGRPRSGSRPRSSSGIVSHRPDSSPSQSSMSFSKYRPLPSISSTRLSTIDTDISPRTRSTSDDSTGRQETNILSNQMTSMKLREKRNPPPEPSDSESQRIQLAIKMLDSSRHERWFRLTDTIEDILLYAESVTNEALPDNCEICTNELPKRVFSDLSLTLGTIGLESRTVLYIQER